MGTSSQNLRKAKAAAKASGINPKSVTSKTMSASSGSSSSGSSSKTPTMADVERAINAPAGSLTSAASKLSSSNGGSSKSDYDIATEKIIAVKGGKPAVQRYTPPVVTPTADQTNLNNLVAWIKANPNTPTPTPTPTIPSIDDTTDEGTKDNIFNYERYKQDLQDEQDALERAKEIQRQGLIDAITNKYNTKIPGIKQAGEEELARTRSMNLRSGLIDSPQGSTELGSTKAKTQAAIDAAEAAKADEITKTLADLDSIYYQRKRDLTTDKLNELKTAGDLRTADLAAREERRKPTATILANLAKNGTTFEQFKLDPSYKNVSKDFTDQELQALFLTNNPSDSFLSDKPEMIGSTAVWYQKQADGTIKTIKVDTGVSNPDDVQVIKTDEGVLVYDKSTGITKNIGGANTPNNETVISEYGSAFVPGAKLPSGADVIDSNGYITPEAWKGAINDAVSRKASRIDFIKTYGNLLYQDNLNAYGLTPVEQDLIKGKASPTFVIQQ